jgi:Histone acetyltransferase
MEQIILNILEALRRGETVDDKALVKLIHAEARREGADKRDLAKRRLLPFYQRVKREEPARWAAWNVDTELERRLLQVLRMKPRRTASGVATITVITKPWPCSGDCLFCPQRSAHA